MNLELFIPYSSTRTVEREIWKCFASFISVFWNVQFFFHSLLLSLCLICFFFFVWVCFWSISGDVHWRILYTARSRKRFRWFDDDARVFEFDWASKQIHSFNLFFSAQILKFDICVKPFMDIFAWILFGEIINSIDFQRSERRRKLSWQADSLRNLIASCKVSKRHGGFIRSSGCDEKWISTRKIKFLRQTHKTITANSFEYFLSSILIRILFTLKIQRRQFSISRTTKNDNRISLIDPWTVLRPTQFSLSSMLQKPFFENNQFTELVGGFAQHH